jgi:hypothetical protein
MLMQLEPTPLDGALSTKLKEIHGEKYTYVGVTDCDKFNKFIHYKCNACNADIKQLLHNHLNGCGCRDCSYVERGSRKRYTFDDVVKIGKELHGETYEYIMLISPKGKVTNRRIQYRCTVCNTVNEQSIYRFIHGTSCRKCSRTRGAALARGKRKVTTLSMVRTIGNALYKRRYRYISLEKGTSEGRHRLTFFCKACEKEVTQTVETHLTRNGCTECAERTKKRVRSFSEQSILGALRVVHKDYEFFSVTMLNNRSYVMFKCPSCDRVRTQDVVALLQGRRCVCSAKSVTELFAEIKNKQSRARCSCIS